MTLLATLVREMVRGVTCTRTARTVGGAKLEFLELIAREYRGCRYSLHWLAVEVEVARTGRVRCT